MLGRVTGTKASADLELGTELERFITSTWWRLSRELPAELSRTGASVLKTLSDDGPQRVTTLAAHEPVAQPTMSAVVQRLERRGLVSRAGDPADGRASLVEITEQGEQILRARQRARARWLAERLAGLGATDREAVVAVLELLAPLLDGSDAVD
jgi:DNA-binding MarR family transcriptional regulator